MRHFLALTLAVATALPAAAEAVPQRLSSDFEIAEMQKQIARSTDFLSQLSARLNLGDLHLGRNAVPAAREEYARALEVAQEERITTRRRSDMTGYATATAYAGLAAAKLRRGAEAFELFEEAIRYTSDSPKTWNLYASGMSVLNRPLKAIAAARNAVAIAEAGGQPLDIAVYEYALASALADAGQTEEAGQRLRRIVSSLDSSTFDALRREVAREESFEIYSTARGEAAAYLSLRNRAQLRLAHLLETAGDTAGAIALYRRVLEQRSDDPAALAALARLSTRDEQAAWFAAAFDANPFSPGLIRAYREFLEREPRPPARGGERSDGAALMRALRQQHDGQSRAARASIEVLLERHPGNTTLERLIGELDAPATVPHFLDTPDGKTIDPGERGLRQLIGALLAGRLEPEQRVALDGSTFRGTARFDAAGTAAPGKTVFESGVVDGVPFRFAGPTAFHGSFAAEAPLRLTYRVLGVTELNGVDAILAEPLGIEVVR